jgi:hypothetical protein
MEVIQYGDKFLLMTDDGDIIEQGFASRAEAVEARERMLDNAVEAVPEEDVEDVVSGRKRGKKVK